MYLNIEQSWRDKLTREFNQDYFKTLTEFVAEEYKAECYPPSEQVFAAFNHTPFDKVKVVLLGQDPYHGKGQANGLCFSVNDGVAKPPSLQNIFKEVQNDMDKEIPQTGNLEKWAKEGVLLLNATLTVRTNQAGSHQKMGWERFTDAVIKIISEEKEGVVFLLWGGYAKKKINLIDTKKHLVLTSGHPSPLSANRGFWFGNRHFSKANAYLEKNGKKGIVW